MASYNLCDEPWIRVKCLDGNVRDVSLTQIFEDAEKIRDVLPPVFRREQIYLYYVVVIKLLSTIVMSAYYKEETHYAAKNARYLDKLLEEGIYSDVIKDYLQKWHDRFDIYDEDHPFLQNVTLRELYKKNEKEFCTDYRPWNFLAPSKNNFIFGKNRSINPEMAYVDNLSQYEMDAKEFAYFLIYEASIGNAISSKHEKSLAGKNSTYAITQGMNLAKTILFNIMPLTMNARSSEGREMLADRPVWELNGIEDIMEFDKEYLPKDTLLCSFFPGISLLCLTTDENGAPISVIRPMKKLKEAKDFNDNFTEHIISNGFRDYHSICYKGEDGNVGNYIDFDSSEFNMIGLCINATRRLGNGYHCCQAFDSKLFLEAPLNEKNVCIYYRDFDTYKSQITNFGVLPCYNKETWLLLSDEDKNALAVTYQQFYEYCNNAFEPFVKRLFQSDDNPKQWGKKKRKAGDCWQSHAKRVFSDFAEEYFFFDFTENLKANESNALHAGLDALQKEAIRIFDECAEHAQHLVYSAKVRDEFEKTLNMYKKEMIREDA